MPVEGAGKLLGRRALAIAALIVGCALAGPSSAAAEQFLVNTTADEADAALGNEFCETGAAKCSLRAAIEEANFEPDETISEDEIRFDEEVFKADADSVIELESALPAIVFTAVLTGPACPTEAGIPRPCAEIAGIPTEPGLKVEGAKRTQIEMVAVTGSEVGIELLAAKEFFVKSNWLGTSLDGTAAGNGTGIKVGPGSDTSRVGGEGQGTGNLIANSSGTGLEISGASNVRVLGNQFGVEPTGTDAAANKADIAISSTEGAVALENTIGTRVSPEAATTPACDGGCNLISGAEGDGIDLSGSSGDGPPVGTTIAGNLIGLDAVGAGAIPNGGAGVRVGAAPRTVVGGPQPRDLNRFAGGTAAVEAEPFAPELPGAPGLTVRGNLIGSRAGAGIPPPSTGGVILDSTGLFFPAQEPTVVENEIGLADGIGISLRGLGGEIGGNLVEGGAIGIEVAGPENRVEGNRLLAPAEVGILVLSGFNTLFGNQVSGSGGPGISVRGGGPFTLSETVVGGDTAASENVIDGSAKAAIEIFNIKASSNEVGRNRGSGNAGLFIDLAAAPPEPAEIEPGDPNNGIQPPAIAVISESGVAGFAEPGAVVRVFRKASASPGELASFLGQATADAAGNWSLGFGAPLPSGTDLAATQTLNAGTSELAFAAIPAPDAGSGPSTQASGSRRDRKPPRTRMLKQTRRVEMGQAARFAFTSNEAGSSFQCSLDHAKFKPCKSPKKYRPSQPGMHLFRVRAIDRAGNVDPTPVRRRFEVLG